MPARRRARRERGAGRRAPRPAARPAAGVKDLEATAGLLTTYGSALYRDHVPAADNVLVARLRAAGAIVTGKTNIPEMGAGANSRNVVWGATGNPFNPNLNAGGSSGGSAAALACDMLPVCTGSDTGGSLRIPAAKCGVVGFRPRPVVPSSRKLLGWTPISVVGPMGRTVADACLQLAASAGPSASDPLTYALDPLEFTVPQPVDLGSLRVAYTEDFGACAVDDDIRRTFRAKIDAMRHLFRRCDEIALDTGEVHRCFDVLRAESFVAGMQAAYERDPASLGPNTRANYEMGARMSLLDSARAQAEQTRILQRFRAAFADYDVILSPTTPVSPFPWTQLYAETINGEPQENYYRWLAPTYVVTLTTHPAISLPCGWTTPACPSACRWWAASAPTAGARCRPRDGTGLRRQHGAAPPAAPPRTARAGRAGADLDRHRAAGVRRRRRPRARRRSEAPRSLPADARRRRAGQHRRLRSCVAPC